MHHFKKTEFIVLKRRNLGEADRIITILSRNYGKLTVIAKGIRRPTSRKKSHLELFTRSLGQLISGRNLDLITEAATIEKFDEIRKDLTKTAVAYFYADITNKLIQDHQDNPEAYNILLYHLRQLSSNSNLRKSRENFSKQMLVATGFFPSTKYIQDPDRKLEQVFEEKIASIRIGKRLTI